MPASNDVAHNRRSVTSAVSLLGRALTRRCPYCGAGHIFQGWFALRDRCPTCGTKFEREEGYFLGAYAINLIVAEIVGLGTAMILIFGTRLRHADLIWQEVVAVILAVGLPVVFFPFSRTLWMALDLRLHPPVSRTPRVTEKSVLIAPDSQSD